MFTSFDKALVALIGAALAILDTVFGMNFGIDEGIITSMVAMAMPALVWALPNKAPGA